MIIGFHVSLSCYGHWQPNDPRGSGSRYVGSKKLYAVGGKATKIDTRHSVAHVPHDVCLRIQIKKALKYPPVLFSEQQIEVVGNSFGETLRRKNVPAFACTVVADHAHLLFGYTHTHIDELVLSLKEAAVEDLLRHNLHPRSLDDYPERRTAAASAWSVGCWKVYINDPQQMQATIRYIENHRSSQHWNFVVPYN